MASPQAAPSDAAPSEQATRAAFDWQRIDLGFVSAYLLIENTQVLVVDSGVEGSGADVAETLTDLGMGWYAVEHVIFTHNHPDHIGSATAILDATDAEAHAGGVTTSRSSDRDPSRRSPTARTSSDCGSSRRRGTPPATSACSTPSAACSSPGTRWSAVATAGGVAGPDAAYTQDMDTAHESVRKLTGFAFDTVLFGHGEPVERDASRLVAELAAQL